MQFGHYLNGLQEFLKDKDGIRTAFVNSFKARHDMTDGKLTPELKKAWADEAAEYITNRAKELASNEQEPK